MECACSVLDPILIYLVLHVKDMSFDKQGASNVTDQQCKTRDRFTTTSFYFVLWSFWGSAIKSAIVTKQTSTRLYSLVQGT